MKKVAWKTQNYYSTATMMEHGEGLGKRVSEDHSPERMEAAEPEKMA